MYSPGVRPVNALRAYPPQSAEQPNASEVDRANELAGVRHRGAILAQDDEDGIVAGSALEPDPHDERAAAEEFRASCASQPLERHPFPRPQAWTSNTASPSSNTTGSPVGSGFPRWRLALRTAARARGSRWRLCSPPVARAGCDLDGVGDFLRHTARIFV